MPKNKIGMFSFALIACAVSTTTAYCKVVYETDFSTRTSANPIPSARWALSAPYHTGALMNNYSSYTMNAPFNEHQKIQDGWAKGNDGHIAAADKDADFVVRASADGNQFAAFVNDGTVTDPMKDHNTRAIHPICNSISSGVLRVQVDLRAPSSYPKADNNNFFVGPYYRKFVELDWGTGGVPQRPGMFGFNLDRGDGNKIKTYLYGGDGKGVFDGSFGKAVTAGHWYRFVVDFDFNAKKITGNVADLGTATPTFETAGGTPATLTQKNLHTDPSDELGPVEGICLADAGSVSGRGDSEDLLKASCADNIRLSWRASNKDFGADDVFYENDFSVRRSRTIVPGSSSTSSTYTPLSGAVDSTFEGYIACNYTYDGLVAAQLTASAKSGKVTQSYGLDGWRRLNSSGECTFSVSNPGGNGGNRCVIAGSKAGQFGIVAQALGTRITSGDVKFSFDFRLPDKWSDSSRWFYGMLAGDDYLNSSTDTEQAERYIVRLGVRGDNNGSFICANRDVNGVNDGAAAVANHYYRGVMTVHLDANPRLVDTAIYDLGMSSCDSAYEVPAEQNPVFSRMGDVIRNRDTFKDISCVAFYAAGVAGRHNKGLGGDSLMFLDNLKVWKKAAAETEWTSVYVNDFKTCKRFGVLNKPYPLLTMGIGRLSADGWVKRNNAIGPLLLTTDANPAAYGGAFAAADTGLATASRDYTWAMQQLGVSLRTGTVTMQVDLRPPRTWFSESTSTVILGNDMYFQGVQDGDHQFLKEYQVRIGFTYAGNKGVMGLYETSKACCVMPDGSYGTLDAVIDPTHWYRFVVTSTPAEGTYDVKVFDLGKTHPTSATVPTGGALGSFENVGYRNPLRAGEGLSTLGLTFQGIGIDRPWETDDPGLMLVDNLRIEHQPEGLVLVFR